MVTNYLNKLMLLIGAILTGAVAILYLLLGRAKAEKQSAEKTTQVYKDAVTENVKELERIKDAEQIRQDVKLSSNSDVDDGLLKYARDRSNKD